MKKYLKYLVTEKKKHLIGYLVLIVFSIVIFVSSHFFEEHYLFKSLKMINGAKIAHICEYEKDFILYRIGIFDEYCTVCGVNYDDVPDAFIISDHYCTVCEKTQSSSFYCTECGNELTEEYRKKISETPLENVRKYQALKPIYVISFYLRIYLIIGLFSYTLMMKTFYEYSKRWEYEEFEEGETEDDNDDEECTS